MKPVQRSHSHSYRYNQNLHTLLLSSSKPSITTHISPAVSRTLELTHSRPHDRDLLPLQKHQISKDNQNIIQRLLQISDKPHLPKETQEYTRFNQFKRPFRKQNHYKNEKQRLIDLQNEKLYRSISGMKPRVGLHSQWENEYKKKQKYGQFYSKFGNDKNKGKKMRKNKDSSQSELSQLEEIIRENAERQVEGGLPQIKIRRGAVG